MIFYVVTGLSILAAAVWLFFICTDYYFGIVFKIVAFLWVPLVVGLGWLFLGVGVPAIILSCMTPNEFTEETHKLKAMSAETTTEGRMFLLSGYVSGERTITYTQQNEDGSFEQDSHPAAGTKVFESDTEEPFVTTTWMSTYNFWVFPESKRAGHSHEFTIPSGSVTEVYELPVN